MIGRWSVLIALYALCWHGALAHANSETVCATAGRQPEVIAASADLQRAPEVVTRRLHLADLLLNAGCLDEAIHVLEEGDPRSADLQYRLTRARNMLRERRYFESIDQAAQVQRHAYAPAPILPGPDKQSAAAQAPAADTQPRVAPARPVADPTGERVVAVPPRRSSFSNLEPASRSN